MSAATKSGVRAEYSVGTQSTFQVCTQKGAMIRKSDTNEADRVAPRGPKYTAAMNALPDELRPIYRALVEDYRFHALLRYGTAWVAYDVIADLVKSGWRPTSPQ